MRHIGRREIKHFAIRGRTRSFGKITDPWLAWDFMGIDGHSIWSILRCTHMHSKKCRPQSKLQRAAECRSIFSNKPFLWTGLYWSVIKHFGTSIGWFGPFDPVHVFEVRPRIVQSNSCNVLREKCEKNATLY